MQGLFLIPAIGPPLSPIPKLGGFELGSGSKGHGPPVAMLKGSPLFCMPCSEDVFPFFDFFF